MRLFFMGCVLALLVLTTSDALADSPLVPPIPPCDDVIVPVGKGQPAPFAGQLFDNDTSLRWANWLRVYKLRLQLDVQEQKSLCTVRTDALDQQLAVQQQKYLQVTAAYEQKLRDLQRDQLNPPWYKSPTFYVVTGVVGTAILFTGVLYADHQ